MTKLTGFYEDASDIVKEAGHCYCQIKENAIAWGNDETFECLNKVPTIFDRPLLDVCNKHQWDIEFKLPLEFFE